MTSSGGGGRRGGQQSKGGGGPNRRHCELFCFDLFFEKYTHHPIYPSFKYKCRSGRVDDDGHGRRGPSGWSAIEKWRRMVPTFWRVFLFKFVFNNLLTIKFIASSKRRSGGRTTAGAEGGGGGSQDSGDRRVEGDGG